MWKLELPPRARPARQRIRTGRRSHGLADILARCAGCLQGAGDIGRGQEVTRAAEMMDGGIPRFANNEPGNVHWRLAAHNSHCSVLQYEALQDIVYI